MSDPQGRNRDAVTRRSFLKGVGAGGLSSTLISTGAIAAETVRQEEAELGWVIGPGVVPITLRVDGRDVEVQVEPRDTLLDALRQGKSPAGEVIDSTGQKRVCDRASCGACSMLVDGELVYGCTVLAIEARGSEITTVQGLGSPEAMHAVQQAFVEHDALMCGFCTPGMVVAVASLLDGNADPSREQVRKALEGNLCRCGTYPRIFEAAETAAARLREV